MSVCKPRISSIILLLCCYQIFVCLSYPYEGKQDVQALDEGYAKIKAGVLGEGDLSKEFIALDQLFNDIKEQGLSRPNNDLLRVRREEGKDAPFIAKCCKVIKKYIDKKKDAHDVLCSESEMKECCDKFADELKKQEDAYDTLCPNNERNECLSSPCDENAICENTLSSFTCTCTNGYSGDGLQCADKDECQESPCADEATCTNIEGSFNCTCNEGFDGNGFQCSDRDECSISTTCNIEATCNNTIGSYSCKCNDGYEGDGVQCSDVDECKTSPCNADSTCANTVGAYICKCKEGYTGDGTACSDIDECKKSPCKEGSICVNKVGTYTCKCGEGFSGDGVTCTDIDECINPGVCDENASCSNTVGSYSCACKAGFTGNGTNCKINYEFKIFNAATRRCMAAAESLPVTANPCKPSAQDQVWRWTKDGSIRNVLTGKCLRQPDKVAKWQPVITSTCNSTDPKQTWECDKKFVKAPGTGLHLHFVIVRDGARVALLDQTGPWSQWQVLAGGGNICSKQRAA